MNLENPTKEMKSYALQEMLLLLDNMRLRPIQCYSQKIAKQEKKFFLGNGFVEELKDALVKQYK